MASTIEKSVSARLMLNVALNDSASLTLLSSRTLYSYSSNGGNIFLILSLSFFTTKVFTGH